MAESAGGIRSNDISTDPFHIVLGVISFFNKDQMFNFAEIDVHKFFFNCKKENPELFEEFLFDEDPELPYSEEIAEALLRLQDAAVFSRPNPAMKEYLISADMGRTKKRIGDKERAFLKPIADKFHGQFAAD